jgi:uncharacterized protein YpmB
LKLSWKMKGIVGIACMVVLAAIITPTTLYLQSKSNQAINSELQGVQQSFVAQNGANAQITASASQTKVYVVAWKDDKNQYVSALIGGVWIKIYGAPLTSVATPSPTPAP